MIRALARHWDAWEATALTCPHRAPLRRYRWLLAAYAVIRVGSGWIIHSLRNRSRT